MARTGQNVIKICKVVMTVFYCFVLFCIAKIAPNDLYFAKIFRGLRPLAPRRGFAPGPHWGLRPQTPAAAPSAAQAPPWSHGAI